MKKIIYLKDIETNIANFAPILISSLDPIALTYYAKVVSENEYPSLPNRIREGIRNNMPFIHIKNPQKTSFNVPTPYSGIIEIKGIEDLIFRIYGAIGIMDTFPILYKSESDNILRVVAPRHNSNSEISSQSPYNDLHWHVDAAYRPMFVSENGLSPMPDYLVFGVVHKGYQDLPITYIPLKDILQYLGKKDIEFGMQTEFTVTSSDSFSEKIYSKNVSLLIKTRDNFFFSRINLQHASSHTKAGQNFLRKIKEITELKHLQQSISVEPGDIVILNNKTILHKRDQYIPSWDGRDRYFIRVYSVKNLASGISDKNYPYKWI